MHKPPHGLHHRFVEQQNTKAYQHKRQPDIEQHRKIGGNPDIDVSYQYLRIFFEPDDNKLKSIYDDYKSGKMLTGELKAILIEKMNAFLEVHQEKREKAKDQINDFLFENK